MRFNETKNFTSKLTSIGEQDLMLKNKYYEAKLKLLERNVVAQEKIALFFANASLLIDLYAANMSHNSPTFSNMHFESDNESLTYEDIERLEM